MCEAFARGLIDYSKYDLDNPNLYRVENIIISKIEKDSYAQMLTLKYMSHVARQTIITPTEAGIKYHKSQVDQVFSLYSVIGSLLLPWQTWNIEQIDQDSSRIKEAEELTKRWEKVFGSLQDPEIQAQLKKLEEANRQLDEPIF